MPIATSFISPPLGFSIPYLTPHAVSVSLPTWRDNVGYEEGEKRVVESMQTGYPRFFVHRSIQKLAAIADSTLAISPPTDKCYLFPTEATAKACVSFLTSRDPSITGTYYKSWTFPTSSSTGPDPEVPGEDVVIYPVFMDQADFSVGKQYWQHTGDGISSRLADHCLHLLGHEPARFNPSASSETDLQSTSTGQRDNPVAKRGGFSKNRHYSKKSNAALEAILGSSSASTSQINGQSTSPTSPTAANGSIPSSAATAAGNGEDTSTYIEERYARNLAQSQAPLAKIAMRRRIAGVLKESSSSSSKVPTTESHSIAQSANFPEPPSESIQPTTRGVSGLTEEDVFLYPTGMSAIFHSFMTVLKAAKLGGLSPVGKSVCFGFPYTDTLKILQKWGPGCHFYGKGLDTDLDSLESLLLSRQERHSSRPDSTDPEDKPILSIFCEFPSNPLLRTPDLQRLRELADRFGCYIVVDETVGGFVNVECLPFADIVCSSLTKVFSGDSNVMGGSLTVNPNSPHYKLLKQALAEDYEDTYFASDAIFMERNSRDFRSRVVKINRNTEAICDFLNSYTVESGKTSSSSSLTSSSPSAVTQPALTKVYYPKYITPHNYIARRRPSPEAGFGGLFSVTFSSLPASRAFFDALECCKGPSLGTNFTLACPYTVLAHYLELEWAAEWEVEEGLVRVSVGLEDEETLIRWFRNALEAAERTTSQENGQ